jgi:hypothetical protein
MKKLLLGFCFILATQLAFAQFTFYSTSNDLVKKGGTESLEHEVKMQVYNISTKDMLLIHNVFDAETEELSDSQVYQITEVKQETEDQMVFFAKSGVSGKTYEYRLSIKEGEPSSLLLVIAGEDYDLRYNGVVTALKTFKQ